MPEWKVDIRKLDKFLSLFHFWEKENVKLLSTPSLQLRGVYAEKGVRRSENADRQMNHRTTQLPNLNRGHHK